MAFYFYMFCAICIPLLLGLCHALMLFCAPFTVANLQAVQYILRRAKG